MCFKETYLSKKDALLAGKLLRKLGVQDLYKKGKRIKISRFRPYLCNNCNFWHLTSRK